MTSIPQKPSLQPQEQSNTSPATSKGHSPAGSVSGKTSAPSATKSSTHTSKKSLSQPTTGETVNPSTSGTDLPAQGPQHGQSPSINGKSPMQNNPTPVAGGPTIVNGNTAPNQSGATSDHSRKPSVTISAAGASGHAPNGGPVAGRPNTLRFGDLPRSPATGHAVLAGQPQPSLGVGSSGGSRVTSPQASPSPIPQPLASGGRLPPSIQGQGNNLNFGAFGAEHGGDMNRSMRPAQPASLGPNHQSNHFRRESSHSTHSDIGPGPGMQAGAGRGGYPQGGRGRGYTQGHQPPVYSPNPSYRSLSNHQQGPPPINPRFHSHSQGRGYPNPPQSAPSPALSNANPSTPQMTPVPMANAQMPAPNYSGYPQQMGSQQVYPPNYDPQYYYQNAQYGMHPTYMPSSPRTNYGIPSQPPYGQYSGQGHPIPQAAPLSRNPSQVSASDRPASSMGQAQPPAPPTQGSSHTPSRSTGSPISKEFVVPPKSNTRLIIRDPGSGHVKNFDKQSGSPARASPSPVKQGATPTSTPPPPTASRTEIEQPEFKELSGEEKKQSFQNAVAQRIKLAEKGTEDQDTPEPQSANDKETPDVESAEKQAPVETEAKADTVKEPEKKEDSKPAEPAAVADDEIDFDAIEKEMAEKEAAEAAAEKAYSEKKEREKAQKAKERAAAEEENLKKAEREAEAAEEERLKKLASGETEADKKQRIDLFAALKGKETSTSTPTDSPAVRTPGASGAATPASDSSMGPPQKPGLGGKRDKPAALKLETNKAVEPPQPSAAMKSLQSARFLEDPSKIAYPSAVVSPNPALNANAPSDRKFKYNKEFLLQFQSVFKEKPSIDWDARVRETVGDNATDSARSSARTPVMGGRNPSRTGMQPAVDRMGMFQTPSRSQTLPAGGQDRFQGTSMGRGPSMGANPFGQFGRPGGMQMGQQMSRNNSSTAMHQMPGSPRSGSHRGTRTGSKAHKSNRRDEDHSKNMPLTAGAEVTPLTLSQSGWKPKSLGKSQAAAGPDGHLPPDIVQGKVKLNLNKMTPENFDKIANQILTIVGQSKDESDGRTLRQVIQLTFEKATDEAHWASMYAKFCMRMLESMSPEIKDENIRDKQGNVVAGGSLFRKYLLNRCQEEFERGWKDKQNGGEEVKMLSDEYYAAAAAKRRGLGLVKFIGELFKLGMLTERIMHECVKKLVDYDGVPDEAEIESLSSLLRTIGASLDSTEKGHNMMDAYFERINKMMVGTHELPSRHKFMLLDIIDLRKAGWKSKDSDKGPKTITEIREAAARAQQEAEMERMRQQANRGHGRMALGRGDARNFSGGYGSQPPPPDYASSKVGSDDLRRLKTARGPNQPVSFSPSGLLGSRSSSGRRNLGPGGNLVRGGEDSGASSRTGTPPGGKDKKDDKEAASSMNAFSALASLDAGDNLATSPPSNPSSPPMMKSRPAIETQRPQSPAKDDSSKA